MATATLTALRKLLKQRFGGVLTKGKHKENGQCCALELVSVYRGQSWTDDPNAVRSFDLRPLNDLDVSDEIRTNHLLPVIAAYEGSLDWPEERQQRVATALAIGVVNVLIAELAWLPAEIAKACREAKTREEAAAAAESAARSAESAAESARSAARSAAWSAAAAARSAARSAAAAAESAAAAAESAAESAARSAESAARSAAESAALERVFIAACKIWLDAAKQ